jgi:hypothetical protein
MYFPEEIWRLILKYLKKKRHLNGEYILYNYYRYYRTIKIYT